MTTDTRIWKKVLIQWVKQCKLIEQDLLSIENSDIEGFFKVFLKELAKQKGGSLDNESHTILTFLQSKFAGFFPQVEKQSPSKIQSSDNIYIYSLLLQYSCVQCANPLFQTACKNLSNNAQLYIASFFKQFVEINGPITREKLHQIILNVCNMEIPESGDVATPNVSPRMSTTIEAAAATANNKQASKIDVAGASGGDGSGYGDLKTPPDTTFISPSSSSNCFGLVSTPMRQAHGTSPTTPKTTLLESRQRDLYTLRAQLETERYEKSLIEMQMKQHEEDLTKSLTDNKKFQLIIKELNDKLTAISDNLGDEVSSSSHQRADQIQKRLNSEIQRRELLNTLYTQRMDEAIEEKMRLETSLAHSKDNLDICLTRVKELENALAASNEELNSTTVALDYYKKTNVDLDNHIKEMRLAMQSKRADDSIECLDNSSNTHSSSIDSSSPENLASAVIDKQLREKEHENERLLAELEDLKETQVKWAQQLHEFSNEQSKVFQVDWNCNDEQFKSPEGSIKLIEKWFDFIGRIYNDKLTENNKLQDQLDKMTESKETLENNLTILKNENYTHSETLNQAVVKDYCPGFPTSLSYSVDKVISHVFYMKERIKLLTEQTKEQSEKMKILNENCNVLKTECTKLKSKLEFCEYEANNLNEIKNIIIKKNIENNDKFNPIDTVIRLIENTTEQQALISSLHKVISSKDNELDKLKESDESQKFELTRLENAIQSTRIKTAESEESCKKLKNELNLTKQELLEANKKCTDLQNIDMASLHNHIQDSENEIILLKVQVKENLERLKEVEGKYAEAKLIIKKKEEVIDLMESKVNEDLLDLKNYTIEIEEKLVDAQKYITSLEAKGKVLEQELLDAKASIRDRELKISILNAEINFGKELHEDQEIRMCKVLADVEKYKSLSMSLKNKLNEMMEDDDDKGNNILIIGEEETKGKSEKITNYDVLKEFKFRMNSLNKRLRIKYDELILNFLNDYLSEFPSNEDATIGDGGEIVGKPFRTDTEEEVEDAEEVVSHHIKHAIMVVRTLIKTNIERLTKQINDLQQGFQFVYNEMSIISNLIKNSHGNDDSLSDADTTIDTDADDNEIMNDIKEQVVDLVRDISNNLCHKLNERNQESEKQKTIDAENSVQQLQQQQTPESIKQHQSLLSLNKKQREHIEELQLQLTKAETATFTLNMELNKVNTELVSARELNEGRSMSKSLEHVGVLEKLSMEEKIRSQNLQLTRMSNSLTAHEDKNRHLIYEINQCDKTKAELLKEIGSINLERESEKEKARQILAETECQIEDLKNSLDVIKAKHEEEISCLQSVIVTWKLQAKRLQEKVNENEAKERQQNEYLQEFGIEMEKMKDQLKEEVIQNNRVKELAHMQIQKLICRNEELELKLKMREKDLHDIQNRKIDLNEDIQNRLRVLGIFKHDCDSGQHDTNDYFNKIKEEFDLLRSENTRLTSAINKKKKELNTDGNAATTAAGAGGGDASTDNISDLISIRLLNDQLCKDNQVLLVKYRDSKQRLAEEQKLCEERIKEQRLELEGKLEKMKQKMKVLYTEEITKMKAKQEREVATVQKNLQQCELENEKYKDHTCSLSTQIVRLNDKMLELQKQNTLLSTKLKHMEKSKEMDRMTMALTSSLSSTSAASTCFKRPNSIHLSTTSVATAPPAVNVGTNLAMEDEEGELFNNTYLTDLKSGHMPDITTEELQYRNSLLPPHLKSAYAAQYDLRAPEEDIKDGAPNLDDSTRALLNTTNDGNGNGNGNGSSTVIAIRKKTFGTNYKRPGPPTPSKHGGRLSFGGTSEPKREILKETYDGASWNTGHGQSTGKTSARFNIFSTRFSLGHTTSNNAGIGGSNSDASNINQEKDELKTNNIKNNKNKNNKYNRNLLRSIHQKQQQRIHHMSPFLQTRAEVAALAVPFCTSTPRKSRIYYDKRRLIDYYNGVSSATSSDDQNIQRLSSNHNHHYNQQQQHQQQHGVKATPKDFNINEQVILINKDNRPKKSLILQRLRHLSASSSSSASSTKRSPQMSRILQNYGNSGRGGGGKNSRDTSNVNLSNYATPVAATYDVTTTTTSSSSCKRNHYQQKRQPHPPSSSSSLLATKKRLGRRLSLHFDGKFFLNYNRSRRINAKKNQQILYENKRKKLQNKRCNCYDQYRGLADMNCNDNDDENDNKDNVDVKGETVETVDNATFDIKNNNYKFVDQINPINSSSVDAERPEHEDFSNTIVIGRDHQDAITLSPSLSTIVLDDPPSSSSSLVLANAYDVIKPICNPLVNNILCNTTNDNYTELLDCSPNNLRRIKDFEQMIVKPEESLLISDRIYNGKRWWRPRRYRNIIINNNHKHNSSLGDNNSCGDGDNNNNDDRDFEELCKNIDSNAPFALEPLHYDDDDNADDVENSDDDDCNCDDDNQIFDEKLNTSFIDSKKHIQNYTYLTLLSNSSELSAITNPNLDADHNTLLSNNNITMSTTAATTAASTATKTTLLSSCLSLNNSSKSTASTTIYPQTNIFDHRLPNISTMHISDKKDLDSIHQQQEQQQKGFNAPRHLVVYSTIGVLLISLIVYCCILPIYKG